MKRFLFFLLLSTLFFSSSFLIAGEDSEKILMDRDKKNIFIGSILTIAVKLFLPKGSTITSWKEQLSDDLFLKDFICYKESVLKNDNSFFRYDYKITSYKLGKHTVKPFCFDILFPDGQQKTLKTKSFDFEVLSVFDKKKNPKTPEKILETVSFLQAPRLSFWGIFWLFAFVLVLLLGIVFALFSKRKSNVRQSIFSPSIPEDKEALKSLSQVDLSVFKTQKEFYERVSYILRHYLERRFSFHAQESTSTELLKKVKKFVSKDIFFAIKDFSGESDLVKFAKKQVDHETVSSVVRTIRKIIVETKREEKASEDEATC